MIRTYAAPDRLQSENRARREVRATPLFEMTKGRQGTENAVGEYGSGAISICVTELGGESRRTPTAGSNSSSSTLSGFFDDFTRRGEVDGKRERG